MNVSKDGLFSAELWRPALEKYAGLTDLTILLFRPDLSSVFDPIHPTPLFQLFHDRGYDPGIFAQCASTCLAQTDSRPAVLLSQVQGLTAIGTSLILDGEVVGAAVAGYALVDFSQVSEIRQIAREAGIKFIELWEIARQQRPASHSRLVLNGELLQIIGDALLRENRGAAVLHQLSARLLNSQDDERRRISRELHDSLNQYLSYAKICLEPLRKSSKGPDQIEALSQLENTLNKCVSETRTLSYLLHPPLLDEIGFASAAREFINNFSKRSGMRVKFDIPKDWGRLPGHLEMALFRILQESVNNAHRHAHADALDIKIRSRAGEITLKVQDHGAGMPPELLERFKSRREGVGVGLNSMRERVNELSGHLEIQSNAHGTLVQAVIPMPEAISKARATSASGAA